MHVGILKVTSERIDKATKFIEDVLESVISEQNRFHVKAIANIGSQWQPQYVLRLIFTQGVCIKIVCRDLIGILS